MMRSGAVCTANTLYKRVLALGITNNTDIRLKHFKRPDTADPDVELYKHYPTIEDVDVKVKERKHPESAKYMDEYAPEPPKGAVYARKPFRMTLEAGKAYVWCTCGYSKNQPFCDGEHKRREGTAMDKLHYIQKFRPHRFRVDETKEYYLCNCKQTNDRPFCDGTHKTLPE